MEFIDKVDAVSTDETIIETSEIDGFETIEEIVGEIETPPVEESQVPILEVGFQIVDGNIETILPFKKHDTDAAYDIVATSCTYNSEFDYYEYGCNLRFNPPKGYYLHFAPRSSNRNTDCYLANSPSTGDRGFTGEYTFCFKPRISQSIKLSFLNLISCLIPFVGNIRNRVPELRSEAPYKVGDRIVQMQCKKYSNISFKEEDIVNMKTDRGDGSYGSTNKH